MESGIFFAAMAPPPLTSRRMTFDDEAALFDSFLERGWTDGLPVVPPTEERVRAALDAGGRLPSDILGTEPVRGRVITAEKVAVNAVMAGCLPEYFPVVAATLEAMCEPQFNLHAVTVSTMGAAILTVVNGPAAREIGLGSGVSVFGPGNRANATIGRAIRLVVMNVTGAKPGELDKATMGHPGKYTWCMAECEETSPWEPLHVERGFDEDESTVTVFPGLSPIPVTSGAEDPEAILRGFEDAMFAAGTGSDELVVVLSPELLGHFRRAEWSKRMVQEAMFEVGTRKRDGSAERAVSGPEAVRVLTAGGAAGGFAAVIPLWGTGSNSKSVTRRI